MKIEFERIDDKWYQIKPYGICVPTKLILESNPLVLVFLMALKNYNRKLTIWVLFKGHIRD